jgi:hypothetical protein
MENNQNNFGHFDDQFYSHDLNAIITMDHHGFVSTYLLPSITVLEFDFEDLPTLIPLIPPIQ